MLKKFQFLFCSLLAGTALWLAPLAKADDWNKKTIMTFNEPVEIPGRVLQPGTYVFKLFDSQSERTIVQIFTADEKQLVATVMAIPDSRMDTPEKTIVTFEERAVGAPEALHSWFYPGDNNGIEFVYNKRKPAAPSYEKPALVAAAPAPEPTPAPVEVAAEAPAPAPDLTPVVLEEKEEEVIIVAQENPLPLTAEPEPTELPKTAGNFAVIPLAGFVLLAGGFTAIRFASRQS